MIRILNALLFIGILLFVGACDLSDCLPSPQGGGWFTCIQGTIDSSGNIHDTPVTLFLDPGMPGNVSHRSTGASLIDCTPLDLTKQGQRGGQGSQLAYFSKPHAAIQVPYLPSTVPFTSQPVYGVKDRGAASQLQTGVYPPPTLLALPFEPLRAQTQVSNPLTDCDPSSPDILQVNQTNNTVTRVGTCPVAVKAVISVASRPIEVELTPDARTALVTSYDNVVNFIDVASNSVIFKFTTDSTVNPSGIAIAPDGTRAYITSFNSSNGAVLAIDLGTRSIIATIPVNAFPQSLFMTPDGAQVYVTFPLGNAVYVIDTLTNRVATTLSITAPYGIGFSPTGTKAYITSASGSPGSVVVLDTATYTVVKSYPVGVSPFAIAVMYGGRYVIVNNFGSNSVSVIDTVTDTVKTTDIGGAPLGISFVQ
ncbi:MAG TPA: hypothetical protein VEU96_16485 [Bryobacteraceae bacterium]|nr:hypothetical protein [Bryobacteraceae bacterium]